jgi:hypothetical protein
LTNCHDLSNAALTNSATLGSRLASHVLAIKSSPYTFLSLSHGEGWQSSAQSDAALPKDCCTAQRWQLISSGLQASTPQNGGGRAR